MKNLLLLLLALTSVALLKAQNVQTLSGGTTISCEQDNTLTLASSEINYDYYLLNDADNSIVGTSQAGTGNTLNFQTGIVSETTNYHVFAANPSFALDLHGGGDNISVPHVASLQPTSEFTIDTWVYPTEISTNKYHTVYRKDNTGVGRILLAFQEFGTVFSFGIDTAIDGYQELDIPIVEVDYINQWVHILAYYDDATNVMKVYRNGVEIGSANMDGTITAPIMPTAAHIGSYNNNLDFFIGKIASFRIWDKALTSSNERSKAQSNFLTNTEPNLIAYYPFYENVGTQLNDVTANANHGSFVATPEWVSGTIGGYGVPSNTQTITFDNTIITVVIACPGDVTAITENGECGAIVNFQNAVATDSCGESVIVSQTEGIASGSIFPIGDTTIEFTAQDDNGNLSTCTFTITVEDNEAPVANCNNLTIQLDEFGFASITADDVDGVSTDNCGVDFTSIDIDTFDCSNVGDNTVILTVTDVNGNVSTCSSTVTVEDVTAPEVFCQDLTIELDADGIAVITGMDIDAGSTDICGIDSYELSMDTFDCNNVGNNTVTLYVTDVNGNMSSCTATVIVEDNLAPELVCMDVTIELGPDGITYISPSDLATAEDPCGIVVFEADVTEVTCADIGTPITVSVFATDGNGNPSFCSSTVTVVDLLGPAIVCPPNEVVIVDPNGTYALGDYIADGAATVTDNCTDPVTIFSQDPAAGTLLGYGVHNITFTAEDEYGNVSTCSFELNIQELLDNNDNELGSLTLYPNPANSQVYLSNPNQLELNEVIIYDLTGRMVNRVDLSNMGIEKTIDVSTLANATYMVVINGAQGPTTKQLIVGN
ncbi:MAG: hypothetical protein DRI84_08370 [Bacteroidetes bacterium]|nr:MAG: hypothetical protein DRI84_08370 [Bacteroidota bacterium]